MKLLRMAALLFFSVVLASCNHEANKAGNINLAASFPDSLPFSTSGMKVITSFIERKAGTMSILYGNFRAQQKSMAANKELADGEIFTLVTWEQQPDEHWFGARIPGQVKTVETIKTHARGAKVAIDYLQYLGKNKTPDADTSKNEERIRFILALQPSVMP